MNEEDYSSDTSDEDYIPEEAKVESEDDDVDEEPCDEGEEPIEGDKLISKKKSKKGKKKGNSKKNPLLASIEEPVSEEKEEKEETVENKQKEESLWADFLADVDEKPQETKPKSKNTWASLLDSKKKNSSPSSSTELPKTETSSKPVAKLLQNSGTSEKVKITKIFEFAGEEVRVEEEVDAESEEAKKAAQISEAQSATNTNQSLGTKRPLGLSSVMSLIDNKKKKLSTLEKTKIDWLNYKTTEGLQDELQHHLKSKDGYLEKREFLERADLRQFEIERNMRMNKRNKR